MKQMLRVVLACLLCVTLLSGCAKLRALFGKSEELGAQELAIEGMDEYRDGSYERALKSFEKLKDWYPFSKYAILAELKIADSHYQLDHYNEAIQAYEEFESLHPRNEAIPYVMYQIGRCYFDQVDTVDRDQTTAQKALTAFTRLAAQYPDDAYSVQARAYIRDCQRSLAGHELYVGLFYYKSKHYKAALERFKAVLTNYPDYGVHQKALQYIAPCEQAIAAEAVQDQADEG